MALFSGVRSASRRRTQRRSWPKRERQEKRGPFGCVHFSGAASRPRDALKLHVEGKKLSRYRNRQASLFFSFSLSLPRLFPFPSPVRSDRPVCGRFNGQNSKKNGAEKRRQAKAGRSRLRARECGTLTIECVRSFRLQSANTTDSTHRALLPSRSTFR